ncbi:histidine kinase [Paenibacillus sp. BAC0078]
MSDQILQQILGELKSMRSDLSEVKVDLSGVRADVSGVKSELSEVKADVSGLKAEFSEMKADLAEVKADIISIKEDTKLIPLIQQAVSEVNAEVIANRDTLHNIEETLRSHDVTLDILSRRSIDQEAALKRIK